MSVPKEVNDEMKRIMIGSAIRAVLIAIIVTGIVLVCINIFGFRTDTEPFVIGLLIVGAVLAVIGNNFVMNATTRLNAKETILWKWGNNIQASGFVITLIAAFL